MALPGGRQSRGSIIASATSRAGNNETSLVQACRVRLNRLLEELYLNWDWPFLNVQTAFGLSSSSAGLEPAAGAFILDPQFLKTVDDWSLVATAINGQPTRRRIAEVDRMTFTAIQIPVTSSSTATVPRAYCIDRTAGVAFYYPIPTQGVTCVFRYKQLPVDVQEGTGAPDDAQSAAYDADIPIFAWGNYLSDIVLEFIYGYENDPRQSQQKADNAAFFQTIRGATFPPHSVMPSGPGLDPDVFGPAWQGEGWSPWPGREW